MNLYHMLAILSYTECMAKYVLLATHDLYLLNHSNTARSKMGCCVYSIGMGKSGVCVTQGYQASATVGEITATPPKAKSNTVDL